jgi:hypothetical protein
MVCIIDIETTFVIWDEPIKSDCDHEQKQI